MAKGSARVANVKTAAVKALMARSAQELVTTAAVAYTGLVKQQMAESPATGRVYRRIRASGVRRRLRGQTVRRRDYITHQASAPGEPPAVDRGTLLGSITYSVERTGTKVTALMGSTLAKIPAALEFGRTDGTIAPRPAWRPAWALLLATLPAKARGLFGR